MSANTAISVQGVSKAYRIWESPAARLTSPLLDAGASLLPPSLALTQGLRRKAAAQYRDFWALKDISFEVQRGEAVGIIGRNGSGKSTLLQIIAGTLRPTSGSVQVNGRVAALLELGSGFNPEFTGRENVYLNGVLLGLTRSQVEARYEDIAAFADIGDFIEQPVKTYSSGMMMRLAFAVATCIDPDVLIVDESLSVGDVFFNQKCFTRIRHILDQGTSLLFVSHDTSAVRNLCDRAILLASGSKFYEGPPDEAASRYFAASTPAQVRSTATTAPASAIKSSERQRLEERLSAHDIRHKARSEHGTGDLIIRKVAILDAQQRSSQSFSVGEKMTVAIQLQAIRPVASPSCGIHLFDRMNNLIFAAGTRQLRVPFADFAANESRVVELVVELSVQPGEYTLSVGCSQPSADGPNQGHAQNHLEGFGPIAVSARPNETWQFYGFARLPMAILVHE